MAHRSLHPPPPHIVRLISLALIAGLGLSACQPASAQSPSPLATPTLPPTAAVVPTASAAAAVSYGAHVGLIGIEPAPILNGVTAMRFEWIAQTIYWRDVETQPGQFNWADLDELTNAIAGGGYHLRLLAVIRGTPDWARPAGVDPALCACRDGPPADPAALSNFLRALAGRYAGDIAAYEIYPEANDARHWASPNGLSPQDYTALLQTAATSIRAADPLAIIVSGGLSPTDLNDAVNGLDDQQFLQGMYAAGAAAWFDALGVRLDGRNNPPTDRPDLTTVATPGYKGLSQYYFLHYERIHALMLASGDTRHPIWLTSVGWASQSPPPEGLPYAAHNTEDQQANYLVAAAYQVRSQPYVQVMIVENFNLSVIEGQSSPTSAFSLIRSDWSARPAFLALAKMRQADVLPTLGAANTGATARLARSR